jgi:tetratricopeptide (TPR) repeat protein
MKYLSILLVVFVTFVSCDDKGDLEKADQLYNKQEYEKAIEAYSKYLEMKPSKEIAIYNRGRAYEELGQYEEAVDDYNRVIEINPRNISAYLSYGKNFYREKDYKNAAYQFEKAYKLNTNSSQAATLLARAYHKSGEVQNAMEYYDIAINNDDRNAEAYLYRGALKIHLNRADGCTDLKLAKNIGYEGAEDLYDQYCN